MQQFVDPTTKYLEKMVISIYSCWKALLNFVYIGIGFSYQIIPTIFFLGEKGTSHLVKSSIFCVISETPIESNGHK